MPRPTLFDHPKFTRLVYILQMNEAHVLGHLEYLWRVGYSSGNPVVGDETDVEIAAKWAGESGMFAKALLQVRLVDTDGNGRCVIHDLHENAPEYVSTRLARETERKRTKTCQNCNGTFHSSVTRALYCSDACRVQHWRSQQRNDSETDANVTSNAQKRTETFGNGPPAHAHTPAHAPNTSSSGDESRTSKRYQFTDEDHALAEWISERVRSVIPNARPPSLDAWANEVRLMRERDHRSLGDIRAVFAWANADSFWRSNILSPSKLREKFDQLAAKKGSTRVTGSNQQPSAARPRTRDWSGVQSIRSDEAVAVGSR